MYLDFSTVQHKKKSTKMESRKCNEKYVAFQKERTFFQCLFRVDPEKKK